MQDRTSLMETIRRAGRQMYVGVTTFSTQHPYTYNAITTPQLPVVVYRIGHNLGMAHSFFVP